MTFLQKLGQFLAKGIKIAAEVAGIAPLMAPLLGSAVQNVQQVATTAANDLTQIGQVVVQAEALMQSPGSGASKLAAAAPLVQQIVQTSQLLDGKKIANPTLFAQGCSKITSGVADCLNAIEEGAVKQA
jgi:hypothetical protein